MPGQLIDRHPERQQIIDAILSGKSTRWIGDKFGFSRQTVSIYKRSIVQPAAELVLKRPLKQPKSSRDSKIVDTALSISAAHQKAVSDSSALSPVRDRIEQLWNVIDKGIARSEKAVRTHTDENGNTVFAGSDLKALPPYLAQAHKNIELLGTLTGELNQPQIVQQVLIVAPAMQTKKEVCELAENNQEDSGIIDITPVRTS